MEELKILDEYMKFNPQCGHYEKYYKIQCYCGNNFEALASNVRRRRTKSCGCKVREKCIERSTKHGQRHTRIYHIWLDMKKRCTNPNCKHYSDYGGRGITLYSKWYLFENFYNDMFELYKKATSEYDEKNISIDRIDNNSGYYKENCRWVTQKVQNNNRRDNRIIEFNGERKTLQQWADETGIYRRTITRRIYDLKWSIEKALTTPVIKK